MTYSKYFAKMNSDAYGYLNDKIKDPLSVIRHMVYSTKVDLDQRHDIIMREVKKIELILEDVRSFIPKEDNVPLRTLL